MALSVTDLATEDDIISLIEGGQLRWAWNIASRDSTRATLRILAQSVCDFVDRKRLPEMEEPGEFDQVVSLIFPYPSDSISAGTIARAWNCSSYHISHLCREGSLRAVNSRGLGRPGATLMVDFSTAVEFLRQRRFY
jgi:hypothetical protein